MRPDPRLLVQIGIVLFVLVMFAGVGAADPVELPPLDQHPCYPLCDIYG